MIYRAVYKHPVPFDASFGYTVLETAVLAMLTMHEDLDPLCAGAYVLTPKVEGYPFSHILIINPDGTGTYMAERADKSF